MNARTEPAGAPAIVGPPHLEDAMIFEATEQAAVAVNRRPQPERTERARRVAGIAGGAADAVAPSSRPRASGRPAELAIGPPAHTPLTLTARALHDELLERLRQRSYDWE